MVSKARPVFLSSHIDTEPALAKDGDSNPISPTVTTFSSSDPSDCSIVTSDLDLALQTVQQTLDNGSKLIVNVSGGKDGIASLLVARYELGIPATQIIVHHQHLPEQWPGTIEYISQICQNLGVTFWVDQCLYYGFECQSCHYRYTSIKPDKTTCPSCKQSEGGRQLTVLQGLLDLVEFRGKFPDVRVRFCTDYTKVRVFNDRMRRELAIIGPTPVTILGERWRESVGRKDLPYLRERPKFNTKAVQMLEYRPILNYRRIDCFRKLREYGIEPHYCYGVQGLSPAQMYVQDEEGGPRCSCTLCFFSSSYNIRKAYELESVKPIIDRAIELEQHNGHTWKAYYTLAEAIQTVEPTLANVHVEDFL